MKKLILAGVFLGGLVVGAAGAGLGSYHLFLRLVGPKEVDVAANAAFEANWLAGLRLGETNSTIEDMETTMDAQVYALAMWNDSLDEKSRTARDNWLGKVKIYHQSYPVSEDSAFKVKPFLATMPGRSPNSTCNDSVCRLDNLRLAKAPSGTNAP
jgi:hypothetical protein